MTTVAETATYALRLLNEHDTGAADTAADVPPDAPHGAMPATDPLGYWSEPASGFFVEVHAPDPAHVEPTRELVAALATLDAQLPGTVEHRWVGLRSTRTLGHNVTYAGTNDTSGGTYKAVVTPATVEVHHGRVVRLESGTVVIAVATETRHDVGANIHTNGRAYKRNVVTGHDDLPFGVLLDALQSLEAPTVDVTAFARPAAEYAVRLDGGTWRLDARDRGLSSPGDAIPVPAAFPAHLLLG